MSVPIDYLEKRLEQAIQFVRFAETKNAALIAACVALLIAELSLLKEFKGLSCPKNLLMFSIALLCISVCVGVYSMFPKFREPRKSENSKFPEGHDFNTAYFDDIQQSSKTIYVDQILEKLGNKSSSKEKRILIDLADQCIQNGDIASFKFNMFKYAAGIAILSFVFLVLSYTLYYF